MERRLSIQLYFRKRDEEVSGQVYNQYPTVHALSDHNGLSIELVSSINPSCKIKWNQIESLLKQQNYSRKMRQQ